MKNQTTADVRAVIEPSLIAPDLTRALRASIRSEKLEAVLRRAGATKFTGTPFEVLEEVAAAETATWLKTNGARKTGTPNGQYIDPALLQAAASTIDDGALAAVAQLANDHTRDVSAIHTRLATNLAHVAIEAWRYAEAESRPVCHSCVAVGGLIAGRASALQNVQFEGSPVGTMR